MESVKVEIGPWSEAFSSGVDLPQLCHSDGSLFGCLPVVASLTHSKVLDRITVYVYSTLNLLDATSVAVASIVRCVRHCD